MVKKKKNEKESIKFGEKVWISKQQVSGKKSVGACYQLFQK